MPETLWSQLKQVIFQRLKQAISQKENTESNARLRQQRESTDSNTRLRRYTFSTIAIGLSCILIFSASVTAGHNFFAKAGASLALGIGAVALGALLGFVFGIPRTLQHDIPPQASQDIGGREKIDYQINTRL